MMRTRLQDYGTTDQGPQTAETPRAIHVSRFTFHVSRPHVSRFTFYARRFGFTLIELLVVIAIIALLAGMIFPVTRAVNRAKIRSKVGVELAQAETAIKDYQAKLGYFPPDNPGNPLVNQLYFELLGATAVKDTSGAIQLYRTLDGSAQIVPSSFNVVFPPSGPNPGVSGIANCTRGAGGDEGRAARPFLTSLKPGQMGPYLSPSANDNVKLLCSSVIWPAAFPPPIAGYPNLNPICYNSSNPTNNPGAFDLWVDVIIDGKTNRISNWRKEPFVVR